VPIKKKAQKRLAKATLPKPLSVSQSVSQKEYDMGEISFWQMTKHAASKKYFRRLNNYDYYLLKNVLNKKRMAFPSLDSSLRVTLYDDRKHPLRLRVRRTNQTFKLLY
jgi:hypothetical protein